MIDGRFFCAIFVFHAMFLNCFLNCQKRLCVHLTTRLVSGFTLLDLWEFTIVTVFFSSPMAYFGIEMSICILCICSEYMLGCVSSYIMLFSKFM